MSRSTVPRAALLIAAVLLAAGATAAERRIRVGLYGDNGHQLDVARFPHPHAQLVAVAALRPKALPAGVRRHDTLEQLLADPAVELVALCSPRRADQARDAIRCLQAGKHVYAEKPSALTEQELDAILAAAAKAGREFHEMAGTAFVADYASVRARVRAGEIGEVIQVFVQKSYRYGESRPQDEAIDGGLFLQVGIHAARLIEHVGGVRIRSLSGWETKHGKPPGEEGDGRIAGAAQATLENGGLATIVVNYLNPGHPTLPHGLETLRVFGTKGFVESVDGGARTRLVTKERIVEPLPPVAEQNYFDLVTKHLATGEPMPLTLEEELHPLRVLLRAKEQLRAGRAP